ncbi:MAG: cobyric acid synthase [Candidatus Rokubacteria bacterium]|nr:cobyric acid synthase [Candidatus Rokubacteria bacterium]
MSAVARPRALMIQGTASHAGKSLLVAGLCRLFRQDGVRVVPFKSQNMSLNAYVTRDGGEMGWAQAMQAEAAGVEPRVEMNPVLLKPESYRGSQVVLLGKVHAVASAQEYFAMTARLWPVVEESYRRLAREANLVLIEGAGSPAEPNLMARDIANMAVARLARAPVILVGDIDRGGVFASLVGTLGILKPWDRRLVKGFIINKFRGDASLLTSAIEFLEERTRRPVLGVVPFLPRLYLPEEDSVALETVPEATPEASQSEPQARARRTRVRIAVVRLPHIANFTDFVPLELDPRVEVSYASHAEDLDGAHLVILPGSKDTIADLRFLKAEGFDRALSRHRERGGAIGGICGGYQMLGCSVSDLCGVESGGEESGLGLLPIATVLEPPKVTRRVVARLLRGPWGEGSGEWEGYEIHMGRTTPLTSLTPLLAIRRAGRAAVEDPEGAITEDGRVWGTYLHGCLDNPTVRERLVTWLGRLAVRSLATPVPDYRAVREAAYDSLADALRGSLDLPTIRSLIGL